MDLFNVKSKKAIVTGAAQGLANGMAEGLMEAGVEVCIIDISEKTADVAAAFCEKGYKCHAVNANLGDRTDLVNAFNKAVEVLGGHLDIIVNAAGIQKRHFCEEFPIEDWDAVININLSAVFSLCQLAGQQYIKQGSKGKIINIASMLSFFGGYTVPAYAASKGGVAQLTKALSNEWASKGININALAPGYMDTEMNVALIADETRNTEILNRIPAKRWGTPDDMKGITIFLSAEASDYLNGAIIPVDGGYLSK
ncbi:2-deoxy-D-gluconate 3-dehydrogenase [Anaerovirgula multivorans]|uniref:2-deoxy-D-gluconate 3-dehydrogenase n=1 Tax=Anaerovirgula multivorans TaxID=312168 RepID=A0A239CBP0_9FIRM|nr:SDR family oxidoreductase [Anaerovirgula multivorans]SNS17520.1 2-deoxy-D-gluconate 3-dehydrogenase [Anaerovirgula multivorans]